MPRARAAAVVLTTALVCAAALALPVGAASGSDSATEADTALDKALARFVARPDGPPGIAVVVQRGSEPVLDQAGTEVVEVNTPFQLGDHTRVASVAKAYSGATSLAEVSAGALSLDSTVGKVLTGMPSAWAGVTLAQLLQHTSGIPDFSRSKDFLQALQADLLTAPSPATLVSYVFAEPLRFSPGSKYHYSNTDNILVGLMVEAATAHPYEDELQAKVATPLGLTETSLPSGNTMPAPYVHGYDISDHANPEDVSELLAAGWTWASGGVVATPGDANAFIRGYVGGKLYDAATRKAQMTFRPGKSEPTGPGTNSAGLGVFRYETRCGTFYGHTGNTPGYTQFVAASNDGTRSASVSVNGQITPNVNKSAFPALRKIFELAVCAAAS
jgi:D-alanyl-D-alanine carboxypeptidase